MIWLDGRILPATQGSIPTDDRGFLLGDGVFETMRLARHHLPFFDAHFARLNRGARLLRLPFIEKSFLRRAISTLIEANAVSDGSIRLTYSRGSGPRGLLPPSLPHPLLLITVSRSGVSEGCARVVLSPHRRDNRSALSRIKHLGYLSAILARMDAQARDADDAILRAASSEHLAEASAANLIMLVKDQLLTPPVTDGALPGVMRAHLIKRRHCRTASLRASDLRQAQGAWLINSLSLRTITALGSHPLSQHDGWTNRLSETLFDPRPLNVTQTDGK